MQTFFDSRFFSNQFFPKFLVDKVVLIFDIVIASSFISLKLDLLPIFTILFNCSSGVSFSSCSSRPNKITSARKWIFFRHIVFFMICQNSVCFFTSVSALCFSWSSVNCFVFDCPRAFIADFFRPIVSFSFFGSVPSTNENWFDNDIGNSSWPFFKFFPCYH